MGTLDSREYDRLKGRKFALYSEGHRRMYDIPIREMRRTEKQFTILEAGFGIGYGLDEMVKAGIIHRYQGCEPNLDSYNYVAGRYPSNKHPNIDLWHEPFKWETFADQKFDCAFCIEVIEHVPMDLQMDFLKDLRAPDATLYFSTPDIKRHPKEGVRTTEEWIDMLHLAGFERVDVNYDHWTHLFTCLPTGRGDDDV